MMPGAVILHPRRLLDLLQARLATRPITVLTGARQTGKTTLVESDAPATLQAPQDVPLARELVVPGHPHLSVREVE